MATTTQNNDDPGQVEISRRSVLAMLGAGVISAGLIAGTSSRSILQKEPVEPRAPSLAGGMSMPSAASNMSAEDMDAMHKQGIVDFLSNQTTPITKGKGNVVLKPTIENGVKVFKISCDDVEWETSPGKVQSARGYNGMLPGPILRATEGDKVRVVVKNNLKESTSVHWHGLYVPNNMDGVPFITQDPIAAGAEFTYEFTLRNPGTHMYHSHHNSMDQVNRGLLGAFIVDPKDPSQYPAYDREYIMILNDLNLGFTINGKSFPATEALVAKKGERVLIRYLNEGIMNHPMHLHGMPMQVFAKDGWPVNPPQFCDTLDVAPGNRYDVIVEANEPGVWAFHCHILNHAEGPEGMFGLVTALVVQEGSTAPAALTNIPGAQFLCQVA